MAAFMLESLVLRGVAVRLGALGYLRLGCSVATPGQTPGIANSSQPLPGTQADNPNPHGGAPKVGDTTKGACPGAGRSRRQAGFPCCQGTARTTTATTCWWPLWGGLPSAAAAKDRALFAGFVASAVEASSVRGILVAPVTGREERSR